MPNIKPISELRNYGTVLKDVANNAPVILTKNGYGEYAVVTMDDYNDFLRMKAATKLREELNQAYEMGKEKGFKDYKEVFKKLEEEFNV